MFPCRKSKMAKCVSVYVCVLGLMIIRYSFNERILKVSASSVRSRLT